MTVKTPQWQQLFACLLIIHCPCSSLAQQPDDANDWDSFQNTGTKVATLRHESGLQTARIPITLRKGSNQLLIKTNNTDTPPNKRLWALHAALEDEGKPHVLGPLAESVQVGGVTFDPISPPESLLTRRDLGLVTAPGIDGQVVHEAEKNLFETRATITPAGDYLLMFPEGEHYGGKQGKVNDMIAYRSSDKGKTWMGPKVAFNIDYSQHGFIPLIPHGSRRIYAFGTQPIEGEREGKENCPIGFRYSDDDGQTWSDARLIRPENDPDFKGMFVMRMCETDSGAWLIGSHEADWSTNPIRTRQYVLRSDDRGQTWTVAPGPRPGGWFVEDYGRMDEGRPINVGEGRATLMSRTPEGHLWASWSQDDGRTWSDPKPTSLIHPDAPPMLFHHSDGKTLVAFHHNRHSGVHFKSSDRSEIWVSLSKNQGRTWSEPRFVFANALAATSGSAWHDHQCSYLDAFADGEDLHLFVPHRWKRVLHLTLRGEDILRLPSQRDLEAGARLNEGADSD